METRTDKIRRLQGLIAIEEAQKAILEKYDLYNAGRQALLNNMKSQLEYEREMELKEIDRPVIVQPAKKSWQDSILRYILIGVIILVIGSIIVAVILNSGLFR
jgi:hypothetical protein